VREIAVEKLKMCSNKRSEKNIEFSPWKSFELFFFSPSKRDFPTKNLFSRRITKLILHVERKTHPLPPTPTSIHQFHIRLSERRDEKHIITPLGRMSISLFDSLYKRQAGVKMEKVT
jgi:hypothetical protein